MSYFKETIRGLGWMGGLRGSMRAVGFLRIAILARLLSPEQFGLFGIATLALSFLEILTETGINVFLIQEKKDVDEYISSAWVVSIIRGILISLVIFISAPIIARFFNTPEVLPYLKLISFVPFIRGFINPSIVKFQKELRFKNEFWFRSFLFTVDSVMAVTVSYVTGSAMGIIWGVIIGAICEVVLSFYIVKPRPKFSFSSVKVKKVIHRGKWMTAAGLFNYGAQQGDDWVVGKLLGNEQLGLYQAAYKISTLPLTEITQVVGKVTFPIYTKISSEKDRLWRAFKKTSLSVAGIIIPAGFILFLFPELIIRILLGPQWLEAADVLRVLAIFGVIRALSGLANSLFLSINKQEYVTTITFVQFIVLAITIIPLTLEYGIVGAGYSSIIAVLVPLPLVGYYLANVFKR